MLFLEKVSIPIHPDQIRNLFVVQIRTMKNVMSIKNHLVSITQIILNNDAVIRSAFLHLFLEYI